MHIVSERRIVDNEQGAKHRGIEDIPAALVEPYPTRFGSSDGTG